MEKYVIKAWIWKDSAPNQGIVETIAIERSTIRAAHITDGWWTRFLQRHPNVSLRCGDATAHVRMNAVTEEKLNHYFETVLGRK